MDRRLRAPAPLRARSRDHALVFALLALAGGCLWRFAAEARAGDLCDAALAVLGFLVVGSLLVLGGELARP